LTLTKRLIIVSLFLFIGGRASLGEEGLLINADSVSYEKEKNLVEASGNVVATYKDLRVDAEHLIYNTKDRTVFADRGFILEIPEERFKGQKLEYNIDTKRGTAEEVRLEFRNIFISGKKVILSTEEVIMTDASFSSCDLLRPHYHISASSITLYPQIGWIVAYMGFFWIDRFPVLPVPTYIYDLGPRGDRRNIAPVPEIGKNDVDGWYGIERLAWHRSSNMYGRLNFIVTEKKGGGAGIDGNYIMDEQNEFYFRAGALEKDGSFGGLTYTYSFGPRLKLSEEELKIYDIFNLPRRRLYEFEIDLSSRERINYERVTFLPDLTLRLTKANLFNEDFVAKGEVGYGYVQEESTEAKRYRSRIKLNFTQGIDLKRYGILTLGVSPDYKWYESSEIWQMITGDIDLKKKWSPIFETSVGYMHYLMYEGTTPFAFEAYYFRPDDEFRERASFKMGESSFSISAAHYMPGWYPKDVDYTLKLAQHCYDIILTYRGMRQEFSIGTSLISR